MGTLDRIRWHVSNLETTALDGSLGARYLPLDPIDFETRYWVPDSGWPITFDQMVPIMTVPGSCVAWNPSISRSVARDWSGTVVESLRGVGDSDRTFGTVNGFHWSVARGNEQF